MADAANGGPLEITDANFADEIEGADGLAMVDFWAEWCGPCRLVGPIVDELAQEYSGRVTIGKLDVDANPQTAFRFNVRSIRASSSSGMARWWTPSWGAPQGFSREKDPRARLVFH